LLRKNLIPLPQRVDCPKTAETILGFPFSLHSKFGLQSGPQPRAMDRIADAHNLRLREFGNAPTVFRLRKEIVRQRSQNWQTNDANRGRAVSPIPLPSARDTNLYAIPCSGPIPARRAARIRIVLEARRGSQARRLRAELPSLRFCYPGAESSHARNQHRTTEGTGFRPCGIQ